MRAILLVLLIAISSCMRRDPVCEKYIVKYGPSWDNHVVIYGVDSVDIQSFNYAIAWIDGIPTEVKAEYVSSERECKYP